MRRFLSGAFCEELFVMSFLWSAFCPSLLIKTSYRKALCLAHLLQSAFTGARRSKRFNRSALTQALYPKLLNRGSYRQLKQSPIKGLVCRGNIKNHCTAHRPAFGGRTLLKVSAGFKETWIEGNKYPVGQFKACLVFIGHR